MVVYNYFEIELIKILFGCILLGVAGYAMHKPRWTWIALLLGIGSIFHFTGVAFAETCDELVARCNASKAWYDDRIALQTANGWTVETNYVQCDLQTPPDPPGSKSRFIQYVGEYGNNNYLGSCALEPLKCSFPMVKVGTEPNGDDKCACPPNMPLSSSVKTENCVVDLKNVFHLDGACAGPPPGLGATGELICIADQNGRDGCAEGYQKSEMAIASDLSDMPMPPGMLGYCEASSPCGEGYSPNPNYDPANPGTTEQCLFSACPTGTKAYSGFMGNSNLSYFGNFPSPAYPEYQGFCNQTGCCMGCRSGFSKSNDFCVNSTGEEPPKLCSQGTVMGAYINTTNSSFGSDAYHTAMDCACPLNSVTRSPNAEKGVMLSGGMHIGGDPNATYQDAVCDYSKVADNNMSQLPDLDDYFDGSKGACALTASGAIDEEKCFKMDSGMKDWIANNIDCGEKQGLDCVSPKIQEMMARCKLVAGVVTCSNFSVAGDSAGEGQARLPDWIVDNADKFGFPLPSFDGFEDIDGTGTGSSHKTSSSTTSSTTTTTSTSSKDAKNPVKMFDDKPTTGGDTTTEGLDYFKDAWNSPKNQELRGKIDEVMVAFQRQRMFEIKMSGGEPPCADFSKVELPYNWKLENICLLEPPYVYYFDVLRDVNLLLSMLLPAIIMLRQ